jgi:hypothetical protein
VKQNLDRPPRQKDITWRHGLKQILKLPRFWIVYIVIRIVSMYAGHMWIVLSERYSCSLNISLKRSFVNVPDTTLVAFSIFDIYGTYIDVC